MTITHAALEVTTLTPECSCAEVETVHWVCHCTDDRIAACGLDVTDEPWTPNSPPEQDCPLCQLAWPDGSRTCPWGCDCAEDCGGPQ